MPLIFDGLELVIRSATRAWACGERVGLPTIFCENRR